MSTEKDGHSSINRRTVLSALATSTATSLAGCGGSNGSSGDQNLGERVPQITGIALAQVTGAENIEQSMLHIKQQVSEVLGVPMEVKATEFVSFFEQMQQDKRTASLFINLVIPVASRLDPGYTLRGYHIRHAGAKTSGLNNYANCKFSKAVEDQATAANPKKRQEHVTKALEAASKDISPIPLTKTTGGAAYRSDQLAIPDDLGNKGIITSNHHFIYDTKTKGNNEYISGAVTPGNMPNAVYTLGVKRPWYNTVYLPLIVYDKNYQLKPALAKDYSVSNSSKTFTFNLHEEATFHNGEPVTAEDAKWTLEWIEKYTPQFNFVPEYSYKSVKAIDEHTLEVNFSKPNPGWLNVFAPSWSGVLPKQHWLDAGANQGPSNMSLNTIVGSGPYKVEKWQPRQLLSLQPYEDHFIDVADKGLRFVGYGDRQAAYRAFEEGSLNVLFNASGQTADKVKNQLSDVASFVNVASFTSWHVQSTHSFAPSMFPEFREALSWAIDRQRIKAFIENGNGEVCTKASWFPDTHPYYPEDDSGLKTVGGKRADPEKAKQILRDAGYGWDDEGRLHYPPDKNLTPPWPKGSSPCDNPDDWPCLPDLCDSF